MDAQHMQPKMPKDWPEVRWILQGQTVDFSHVIGPNYTGCSVLLAVGKPSSWDFHATKCVLTVYQNGATSLSTPQKMCRKNGRAIKNTSK